MYTKSLGLSLPCFSTPNMTTNSDSVSPCFSLFWVLIFLTYSKNFISHLFPFPSCTDVQVKFNLMGGTLSIVFGLGEASCSFSPSFQK